MIHEARIDVDEEGTTAVAFTMVVTTETSSHPDRSADSSSPITPSCSSSATTSPGRSCSWGG
ncbi:MAG: hypothetical protein IPI35_18250 [Deltaproteobacteria bacterium]|nr:hypothetical protein [Deltaproteobacteria bacterium]